MSEKETLLIIGAREKSLGDRVHVAAFRAGWDVITAGISGEEMIPCDITDEESLKELFSSVTVNHVLVTAGVNDRDNSLGDRNMILRHLDVNCAAVIDVLYHWTASPKFITGFVSHFVAISSNSARIARSNSTAYCASKAALSMALRCEARTRRGTPVVYGWELGLLKGTPMTEQTEKRFGPVQTRMPGLEDGLDTELVARHIFETIRYGGRGVNGCLFRLDGGEQ